MSLKNLITQCCTPRLSRIRARNISGDRPFAYVVLHPTTIRSRSRRPDLIRHDKVSQRSRCFTVKSTSTNKQTNKQKTLLLSIFSFLTYKEFCVCESIMIKAYINTTGATNGAGTAYHSGAPVFTPWFLVGFVLLDL